MNELTTTEKKEILPQAKNFLEHAHDDLRDIGNRFFMLGCRLWEARRYNYVEALGYESIEQLAEKEFDLGKSSTYNLINVFIRFCARGEQGQYKAWIDPTYKNYKYSQLIEMEKAYVLPTYNIEKRIPPTTPIRILKEYIKDLNKKYGHIKDLPEWRAEQEQTPVLPPVSDNNPINKEPADTIPDTNVAPTVEQPAETVQTFGLPTCAEPEQTETVAKPKASKPTYSFHSRESVRIFLKDYESWKKYAQSWGSPFFKATYGYIFKNGSYIMACERSMFEGAKFDEKMTVIEPIYFLSTKYGFTEISKNQFEQYCAEHKDEL